MFVTTLSATTLKMARFRLFVTPWLISTKPASHENALYDVDDSIDLTTEEEDEDGIGQAVPE
ncbi:hypothetical protein GCK32_021863, partial [Trichostrongylus colubriformis]